MFKVPIIPSDLRHEETIIQAAYALDCLQNTIVTIFERIDKRIEKNNVKVKELQERINKSQVKINSLKGTRKAIRIYAPARFPSSNIFKDIPVTFEEDRLPLKQTKKYQVRSKLSAILPSISEKLIFFHVRHQNNDELAPESALSIERHNIKQSQYLGKIPPDLRSIPSTLLFNTDDSVYTWDECDRETMENCDTWRRKPSKNKQHANHQLASAKKILEPAPHSLVHRRNEKLTPSGGLKYTPKLCEAPELNLPLDLPDLPGIADDLRYESPEAKQRIAPSLAFIVEDLPELTELIKDNNKNANILNEETEICRTTTPPPPPPPPLIQTNVPPPPPPPPPAVHQLAQVKTKETSGKKVISPTSTDTRSELMAAIRNAGGIGKARLRSAAAAPLENNEDDVVDNTHPKNSSVKKLNSFASSQGSDLMADLHNKLLMRRKGISGSKNRKSDDSNIKNVENTMPNNIHSGNPVISHLSSLIPPPPVSRRTARSSVTSSEEDDKDSNDADWVD